MGNEKTNFKLKTSSCPKGTLLIGIRNFQNFHMFISYQVQN